MSLKFSSSGKSSREHGRLGAFNLAEREGLVRNTVPATTSGRTESCQSEDLMRLNSLRQISGPRAPLWSASKRTRQIHKKITGLSAQRGGTINVWGFSGLQRCSLISYIGTHLRTWTELNQGIPTRGASSGWMLGLQGLIGPSFPSFPYFNLP